MKREEKENGKRKKKKTSKKLASIVITAMIVFSLMPAFVPLAAASPGVTAFTIEPNTGITGKTVAYNITLNATPWQTLNITIPAGFEAVAPTTGGQLLAKVDFYCDGAWCGNITIKSYTPPSEKVGITGCNKSGFCPGASVIADINYNPGATTEFVPEKLSELFPTWNASVSLTLPTEIKNGSLNISLPAGMQLTNATINIGQFVKNPTTAGNYTFVADGVSAYVRIPGIELNPGKGPKESWVWINGSNFASNEYVGLYFDDVYWTTRQASETGVFNKSAKIPAAGASWVNATGDKGSKASTTFNVTTPKITLIPDEGPIGANITVNATGFVVGATLKDQYWNGTEWYTINTSTANGGNHSFTDVTIRDDISTTTEEGESVNIRVAGTSGAVIPDKQPECYAYALYVMGIPSIKLEPNRGPPGVQINVTGKTFTPNANGVIMLSNATWQNPYPVGGFTTDVEGGFITDIMIPTTLVCEPYNITARDDKDKNATKVFTVTKEPELTVTPVTGPVDVDVTLEAMGFLPEVDIGILYLNETGNWTRSYQAETEVGGDHKNATWKVPEDINTTTSPNLQANQTGMPDAYANYTVTPTIKLNRTTGIVGTPVNVSGKAFGNITVHFGGMKVAENTTAPGIAWRDYTAEFPVPAKPSGNYTVNVTDQKGLLNTTTFTVQTNITLNATEGYVGDTVMVNGTAFGASKTVDILFNGSKVTEGATDVNGTFTTATFAVLPIANETYNVTARNPTERNATAKFTVLTKLVVSPKKGHVAKNVTLTGTAFGANENVTITLDGTGVGVAKTGEKGSFAQEVTIPAVPSGTYNFTATGEDPTRYSDKASFEVLMTLFIKAYRDGTKWPVNGSWPSKMVTFNVTQNDIAPTRALVYIGGTPISYSDETTGWFNFTFTDKGTVTVQAKNHTVTPAAESNIIDFNVSEPELKLIANDTTINPVQCVLFTLTDQFSYPLENGWLFIRGLNLSEKTNETGNVKCCLYFDVGEYRMQTKWGYKGETLESNNVTIEVRKAAVTIEPKEKTVAVNETVEFTLYNEWSEAVNITGIEVTPGTADVNWTTDVTNATVEFLKENVYNVTATDARDLNDTAVITVGVAPLTVTANVTSVIVGVPTAVEFNVTTSDGAAVEGALVSVSQAGTELVNGTTASTGLVTLSVNATSAGTVNVTASKTGYTNGTTTIEASEVEYDPYDANKDRIIDIDELMAAIGDWKLGIYDIDGLMTTIGRWKAGSY